MSPKRLRMNSENFTPQGESMTDYIRSELEEYGICVVLKPSESTESLIKRFRKKFMKSGKLHELRERTFYEKPSIKRRRKKIEAKRKQEKEDRQRQLSE